MPPAEVADKITVHLQRQTYFLIDPRTSKRIGQWDALTTLALVYTALVTPAEVALVEPARTPLEPMFLINRLIDIIFLLDMVVQFCLMVEKQQPQSSQGTLWLLKPSSIAREYLKGWFALDLLSVFVSVFDLMGLDALKPLFEDSSANSDGDATEELSNLKVLRVLRVLRLIKLARLIRASRMVKRWESRLAVNYALLALSKAIVTMVIMAHWIACVWTLQARIQSDLGLTWMGRLDYCSPPVGSGEDWDCPPFRCYTGGLYYAAATITSIGYGDITPTHGNIGETIVAVMIMFSSCVVWAHVIGVFSGVVSSFNPERNAFRETMDTLNRFIKRESFPKELARRMREYCHQSQHLRAAKMQKSLMADLPPSLQGEVSWRTNQTWLTAVPFLKDAEPQFMLELSLQLHAVVFSPSDFAPEGYLFIVQRGLMVYRGKVLTKGRVWGEDMVLQSEGLRRDARARAMNYVAAYYVSRTELLLLASRYPVTAKKIRRYAILLALGREVIMLANVFKVKHQQLNGGNTQLHARDATRMLMTTISNATQIKKELKAMGASTDQLDDNGGNEHGRAGGRLSGYAKDVGVQFEIMNNRMNEIQSTLAEQANMAATQEAQTRALTEAIEQMRTDSRLMMESLSSRLGLFTTSSVRSALPSLSEDRVQDGERACGKDRPDPRRRHRRTHKKLMMMDAGGIGSHPPPAGHGSEDYEA